MNSGHFYFLTDKYFDDFPDPMLMLNKESIDGHTHDRPCFYAFKDSSSNIYWMIPFSSQVNKYRQYYNNKIQLMGRCSCH